MVKRKRTKDRQYNGQKKKDKGQTIQWSKEKGRRTDNTRVKRKRTKDRQYNGQKKKDKGHTMVDKTLHRKLKIEEHKPH
jgi:hypothetical protein